MKNKQKFLAVFSPENGRGEEAYNVQMRRWEPKPESIKDSDFHFNSEKELNDKMNELGVVNYHIEDAYWPEELNNCPIKVNKADYEVYKFISGYYGICKIGSHGGQPVYGGDSACEDHYNVSHINEMYEQWDGTLTHCGNNKYGEDGYTIEG